MKCIFFKYYTILILHFNKLIKGLKEIKSKPKKNPYRIDRDVVGFQKLPNDYSLAFGQVHFITRFYVKCFIEFRNIHQRSIYPELSR